MRYPHVNNYLKYSCNPDGTVTAVDYCTEKEYEMEYEVACLLRKMDGTRPLSSVVGMSRQECAAVEDELLEMGLLRKNRLEFAGLGTVIIALWMASGRSQRRWKALALRIHRFVRIAWFPVLAAGAASWFFFSDSSLLYGDVSYSFLATAAGYIAGILLGALFHEISHAATGMAYGAAVYELGIGLAFFLPCGYVIMDESRIKKKACKAQMLLAGIKMNFLLAGASLLLALVIPPAVCFLWEFAFMNIILGFVNLFACGMTDGYLTLTTMLGIPQTWSFEERIQVVLGKQRLRKAQGINSGAMRLAILLLLGFQICFVFLVIYDLWSWIAVPFG